MKTKFYSPVGVNFYPPYQGLPTNDVRVDVLFPIEHFDAIQKAVQNDENIFFNREILKNLDGGKEISDQTDIITLDVEKHNNEVWGVATVEHQQPFTENEITSLKQYIHYQYFESWGSEFEKNPIDTGDNGVGDIYVSFWYADEDYALMSKQEFPYHESEPEESIPVGLIHFSPDFQCDQTGGFPTILCWNRENGTAIIEPAPVYCDNSESAKQCFRDCADWGVRPCTSWEDYNRLLEGLGRDAYENAVPLDDEFDESEGMGGINGP